MPVLADHAETLKGTRLQGTRVESSGLSHPTFLVVINLPVHKD